MSVFEITIQRRHEDQCRVVVEESAAERFLPMRSEGYLELDLEELQRARAVKDYGTVLGKSLFRGEVRDAYTRALAHTTERLHVLLQVEDEQLRSLHWGHLCAPNDGEWDFVRLDQKVPFSLYLPSTTETRFPFIGRQDLRSLIVVANPRGLAEYGLEKFDDQAWADRLRGSLGVIPCDVLALTSGAVGPPSLNALCERISSDRYTLLHIVCHGKFRARDGESLLFLSDENGDVGVATGSEVTHRFRQLRGSRGLPHFSFLCSCESGAPEAEVALGGIGHRLVREVGMPAVIAMSGRISLATAELLGTHFYERLRRHGVIDVALDEACAVLADRGDITIPTLFSRLAARPLFTDDGDPGRPLSSGEIANGISRLEKLILERAPSLRRQLKDAVGVLRKTVDPDVDFESLGEQARRERDQGVLILSDLADEVLDISFPALARGKEPPAYDARCPFPGLLPFHEGRDGKSEFYFGREKLINELAERLVEDGFVAVLGPSGSGKSSLVRAGLVRQLKSQKEDFTVVVTVPGSTPLARLQHDLSESGKNPPELLIIDQFETLFTHCSHDDLRREFIDALLSLVDSVPIVMTMRADFLGECAPFDELRTRLERCQKLIAPMDFDELRSATEQQARAVGLRFEGGLVAQVLDDVSGEPGAMPLLQHALYELWNYRHGQWLRSREYNEPDCVGGVKKAITKTADTVYRSLDPRHKHLCRSVFLRLTRVDLANAETGEVRHTRQRVAQEDLVPHEVDASAVRNLVAQLADAKLVVTSTDPVSDKVGIEVAHEALLRYWKRLKRWILEDQDTIRRHMELAPAAQEWSKTPHDRSLLIHREGRKLDDAVSLAEQPHLLTTEQQQYVAACRREARRRKFFVRASLSVIAILCVVAVGAFVAYFQSEAEQAKLAQKSMLSDSIQRELDKPNPGWSDEDVEEVEAQIFSLAELDAAQASRLRGNLTTKTRDALLEQAAARPATRLEFDGLKLLFRRLELLDKEIAAEIAGLIPNWVPLMDDKTAIFDATLVRFETDHFERLQAEPTDVPLRFNQHTTEDAQRAAHGLQLEMRFDNRWREADLLGARIELRKGKSFAFQISSTPPSGRSKAKSAETPAAQADDRYLGIFLITESESIPLRNERVTLPSEELDIRIVSRVDDRLAGLSELSFTANEYNFDFQHLDPGENGTYSNASLFLLWPHGVGLDDLHVSALQIDMRENPFAVADRLYAKGDYSQARDRYGELASRPGISDRDRRNALLRQALCYKQGISQSVLDDYRRIVPICSELMSDTSSENICRLPAAATMLYFEGYYTEDAQAVRERMERLQRDFTLEELFAVMPLHERQQVFDGLKRTLGFDDVHYMVDNVHDRAQLMRLLAGIQPLVSDDPYDGFLLDWRLIDAMRFDAVFSTGDDEPESMQALNHALAVLEDARTQLAEKRPAEYVAVIRDYIWMLIRMNEREAALENLELFNEHLEHSKMAQGMLLVERFRVHAAFEEWDVAAKSIEEFFERLNRKEFERADFAYSDFAEACIFRGFAAERRGDREAARQYWLAGRYDTNTGIVPRNPVLGGRIHGKILRDKARLPAMMSTIASLIGEASKAEARATFNEVIYGTSRHSGLYRIIRRKAQEMFPTEFLQRMMRSMYSDPKGREIIMDRLLGRLSFYDYHAKPGAWMITTAVAVELPEADLPPDIKLKLYDSVLRVFQAFTTGTKANDTDIGEDDAGAILYAWDGNMDQPGSGEPTGWKGTRELLDRLLEAGAIQDDLAGMFGYVIGTRMLREGDFENARTVLEYAVAHCGSDERMHALALRNLKEVRHRLKDASAAVARPPWHGVVAHRGLRRSFSGIGSHAPSKLSAIRTEP